MSKLDDFIGNADRTEMTRTSFYVSKKDLQELEDEAFENKRLGIGDKSVSAILQRLIKEHLVNIK